MNRSDLPKVCVLFVLWVTTLTKIASAECPSKEWRQYKEEKCVRVLDLLSNHPDAELTCQEYNSTLLSITSIEEQEYLESLLFSELELFDNVWLGAVRVNSTTFEWTDGSLWTFDNWKEGSPSDVEGDNCVQMVPRGGRRDNLNTFDLGPSGLWSDVACGRRNLVVCQRRPTFSLDELTALVFQHRQMSKELENKLVNAEVKLKELEKNPVPLGFLYTQLSGQPEPSVIWPTVEWTQVTQDYAGQFFRAEGGNSSTFGQVQNDQSPRLSRVVYSNTTGDIWGPRDVSVPERGASESIFTGTDNIFNAGWTQTYKYFLSFHNSDGEVRPKNQAIRLWKRTA